MHYEVEQAGTDDGRWRVVDVFDAEVVPTPLTFDTVDQALAYVARTLGTLRIVEVDDEGERVPVDTATL
jgi:hypothetical protein